MTKCNELNKPKMPECAGCEPENQSGILWGCQCLLLACGQNVNVEDSGFRVQSTYKLYWPNGLSTAW